MSLCDGCHAGCCRSFAVPLTGADIIKIEQDQNLTFWEFACRWEDKTGSIAGNYAPHVYFSDEPATPFVICLSHTQSQVNTKTDKCHFLNESKPDVEHPLGTASCGIYNSRPSACRAFPTRLNETGELAILYDIPERGRTDDDPIYQLCPKQWKPEQIDPISSVQDLIVAKHEMVFYSQLIETWNRNPKPWNLFPDFLHLVYSQRVQRAVERDQQPVINQEEEELISIPFPVVKQTRTRHAA